MKNTTKLYGGAAVAYGTLIVAFAAIEWVLIQGIWMPFDIASYYGLASSAVPEIYAVIGQGASSSMLTFNTGATPGYRIFAVGLILLASALIIMETGRRWYGGPAGFLAGLLFTMNLALMQGHLTLGDALALLFAVLSAYALFCVEWGYKYAASGFMAGMAMCFKPLAIVLLPAALTAMYRKGGWRSASVLISTAALPILAVAAAALALHGGNALTVAADSGFTAAGFLTAEGYRPPDLLTAVAGIALSACMLTSVLPLALLGFSRNHGLPEKYCLAVGLCFMLAMPLKLYFDYWFIALPFLTLLCVSVFLPPGQETCPTTKTSL